MEGNNNLMQYSTQYDNFQFPIFNFQTNNSKFKIQNSKFPLLWHWQKERRSCILKIEDCQYNLKNNCKKYYICFKESATNRIGLLKGITINDGKCFLKNKKEFNKNSVKNLPKYIQAYLL